MSDMSKKDVNDRIELFYKNKTYTYIKNTFNRFFNGKIKKIDKNSINFEDDILGEIPINKDEIINIDYSNKIKGDKNVN